MAGIVACPSCGKKNRVPARASGSPVCAACKTALPWLVEATGDELDAHVAADRGETAEGGFTAAEPGRYSYYCTVAGHRDAGMEGTLVVE